MAKLYIYIYIFEFVNWQSLQEIDKYYVLQKEIQ